jgi:hypothetical protein
MKKSELRQLIREEISKVLNENNSIQKWKIYYKTASSEDRQWYISKGENKEEALDNLGENKPNWKKLKKFSVSVEKYKGDLEPYESGGE